MAALLAACRAAPACAQVAGRVSLASDDRFRGHSLSDGRPVLGLDLSYDTHGAYIGGDATAVDTKREGVRLLGTQVYAGYAVAFAGGRSLDLGLTHSSYSEYYSGDRSAAYTEVYAGVITEHFASHLYYSPNYFGIGAATLYGEVNGVMHPWTNWRATAHLGLLERVGGDRRSVSGSQYDWRVGIGTGFHGFDAELAWTGYGPGSSDYAPPRPSRQALVFALARSF